MEKPHLLIESCFTIVDKNKKEIPFFFNDVQKDFIKKLETLGTSKPFFILKGRQQGFTTLITAIQLAHALVRKNFSGFTLADRDDNTKAIFMDKLKLMYSKLPKSLRPSEKFNSANELYFDRLNSSLRISSAQPNVGRSRTLSFIHYSEVAFYNCSLADLQRSIGEAATSDAIRIYETTANGFNEAKALWDSGSCNNLFYEWWKTPEYSSNEYEFLEASDAWLKARLKTLEKRGVGLEQRTWYAKKYSSYIDKSSIKQEYPCSPEEAFVSSGSCIFDKDKIGEYISSFNITSRRGLFEYDKIAVPIHSNDGTLIGCRYSMENIRFKDTPSGFISIVEEPFCENRNSYTLKKPYVIGADTAGTGKDYFTAKVIDNESGMCVATLRKQYIDEDLFAEQLYCLGTYYNCALIGVETNYSRHPVLHLRSLGYGNLYSSNHTASYNGERINNLGFLTTSLTRPIIISNLVSVMRDNLYLETDRQTLNEMTTFIRHDDGKSAAAAGAHDDLVMASAIARYIGIEYEHNKIKTDTSEDFLLKNFYSPKKIDSYLEW